MLKNMEISLPGIDEASTFAHIVKCVKGNENTSFEAISQKSKLASPSHIMASPTIIFARMTKTMDFDVVVFDTAPTGHTLRLLQMPGSITKMIEKFLQLNASMGGMLSQVWEGGESLKGRARPGPQGTSRQSGSRVAASQT